MKRFAQTLFICLIAAASVFVVSCRKKKDTIAKVYIIDSDNNRVPGAQVVLKGVSTLPNSPTVTLYDTTVTNSSGEATFNFNEEYQKGQAGVAVLNIEASFQAKTGQGIIKIVEEETVEETVFIQ